MLVVFRQVFDKIVIYNIEINYILTFEHIPNDVPYFVKKKRPIKSLSINKTVLRLETPKTNKVKNVF